MTDRGFLAQLEGCGMTTAEIHFFRLDAPSLLQLFVWQDYDLAPDFPVLFGFLDHWRREIEAPLHSVRVAHDQLIAPPNGAPRTPFCRCHDRRYRTRRLRVAAEEPWS